MACYIPGMALRDLTLNLLRSSPNLDDDEIAARLKVDRHYVNSVCRQLASEGLVVRAEGPNRKLVNRLASAPTTPNLADSSTVIGVAPANALPRESPSLSQAIRAAKDFELHAKQILSARWGVSLDAREVRLTDAPEPKVKFDLVSADGTIVGDAKLLKNIPVPAAKWSVIAEYVWLLQHATTAKRRFMVFGQDREVPERWLVRYRPLTEGVEFYFLNGDQLATS